MKYKSIIEKADDFSAVLMTENGYPVYDIMVPSTQNYCSASGMAFYTEDDKLLKEFSNLDIKERKAYLIANPQYVRSVIDIFKESPEMNHPMPLAYNHLLYDFEGTVKKGYYGCTHLISDGELLIFHQSQVFQKTGYKLDSRKSFSDLNEELESLVANAYKQGTITPEGKISGKALERLKSKNPDIFKEMSQYQNDTLYILKSFKNELLDTCRLTYEKKEDLLIHLEINNKVYDITVPKEFKQALFLSVKNVHQEFKNIQEVIISIYGEITSNKLNSFIKKSKI